MNIESRLAPTAPKKMLALDGGGIRGVITLEVLAEIEKLLQRRANKPNLVLADYFDYISGTSTGAIIAACLSFGMSVGAVQQFYSESGPAMFDRAGLLSRFHHKFEDEKLSGKLRGIFGADTTLGSAKLRTLLMIVLRNASTDSAWPLSNNPKAKYAINLNLPLWQLVRASTAAPTYFPPEQVTLTDRAGKEEAFLFVDGGITMYNNPAFQLFLMATTAPYNLCWKTGSDDLLLVSIGTGTSSLANKDLQAGQMNLLYNAASIPAALMSAALRQQDFLCRVFGECRYGTAIDREIGDMINQPCPGFNKLFTYLRYNTELTRKGLDELKLPEIVPENVQMLDSVAHVADLALVGKALAAKVTPAHFQGFL